MTIFEWKSEYETGVDEIDNQHKVLVSLINELGGLVGEHFDRGAAQEVFNKLKNYTIFHFATEESLMAQYHYVDKDLHAHLLQHRQFEREIASVQDDFGHISLEDCNVVLSYLKNWLIKHICKVDHRLAAFILSKTRKEISQISMGGDAHEAVKPNDRVSTSSRRSDVDYYLTITRAHIASTDEMLFELEACIGELRGHCDTLVKSASENSLSQVSDEAYTHCVQSTYLVKLLQNKHIKLKELLDRIGQVEE